MKSLRHALTEREWAVQGKEGQITALLPLLPT